MFKFDFDLEDDIDDTQNQDVASSPSINIAAEKPSNGSTTQQSGQGPFVEISLSDLIGVLPPLISYSPLRVPLSSGRSLTLSKRDLYDARFQLISRLDDLDKEENEEGTSQKGFGGLGNKDMNSTLDIFDAPSDLVPGVYEGGLKTWECSLDLVDYLDGLENCGESLSFTGKRILEVGCGTAVPSLFILTRLFSSPASSEKEPPETHIHLQDYNRSVLELVTLPNILIAWYMSPASSSYRSSIPSPAPADSTTPGELPITPSLTSAFLARLSSLNIKLRFFSGSWDSFDLSQSGAKYDVILTSETIYSPESLGSLVKLLWEACGGEDSGSLDSITEAKLSLSSSSLPASPKPYLCLVAAKVLYFGVGGGLSEFVRAVEDPKSYSSRVNDKGRGRGRVETVWERRGGVGRRVVRVLWE